MSDWVFMARDNVWLTVPIWCPNVATPWLCDVSWSPGKTRLHGDQLCVMASDIHLLTVYLGLWINCFVWRHWPHSCYVQFSSVAFGQSWAKLKPCLHQIHVSWTSNLYPSTCRRIHVLSSGYKWIHVDVTTVLSPIHDTCRRWQGIQVDTTCIQATCIRCKRGIRPLLLALTCRPSINIIQLFDHSTVANVSLTVSTMNGRTVEHWLRRIPVV